MAEPTTRAYTLNLSGEGDWRSALWQTHVAVNRGAQVWGDWLLTLRGGLPASLADGHPDRRVLLALSWLSVESPASLAPAAHIVARAADADREEKVLRRFHDILARLSVDNAQEWVDACEPALTARIRDDAVWVDRSAAFAALQGRFPGLTAQWAADTLFSFLGNSDDYFALPDSEAAAATEAKDFVQKAGGWLSRNWGSGEKSDSSAIHECLVKLSSIGDAQIVGRSGRDALAALLEGLGTEPQPESDTTKLFKQLKQVIGWRGRPSKGAMALEKIRDADTVSADLWQRTVAKLQEEATALTSKSTANDRPAWMQDWRGEMETRLGFPYRIKRDLIWEHGVMLDHALRRVSAGHTWIKRAEAERRRFKEDAAKIDAVPDEARAWLDAFCERRSARSGALGEYIIRKRAIDGWEKVVNAWAALPDNATRRDRIEAARDVQANLDENEKFGDIQLFAGFGDDDDESPEPCLADDDALCVWRHPDGRVDADILKNYVAATVAEHDQRRFKVPAYRHPDPLRNPIYVDYGNSRWSISYSALKAATDRQKAIEKLTSAKTEQAKEKLRSQLAGSPELRGVSLGVWNGQTVATLPLRWQGKRLWKDLDLEHFAQEATGNAVARADRLGRIVAGQSHQAAVLVAEVFAQKDWNGRLQAPRDQLDRLADLVYGKDNGKRNDPDYAKLADIFTNPKAAGQWNHLRWFLTTSAKLQPQGPWLDYVAAGLPEGVAYKKGRSGYYLDYAANQGRKGRARLQLARLPGLRVLSLDLGHRYAAACAVWETVTGDQMREACRTAGHPEPAASDLFIHLRRPTNKLQKSGRNKGQRIVETIVYRRIGADQLPDGSPHPAPWARLERQFLIKLQGEDRPARRARPDEIDRVNEFRRFLGLEALVENLRVDALHKETVRLARLGLRRLGEMARIAYIMTATTKPISGGRRTDLTADQRIEYVQDALVLWHGLASPGHYDDPWARQMWEEWIVGKLGGPQAVAEADDEPGTQRRKKNNATRELLKPIAEKLADATSAHAVELNRLWSAEWEKRQQEWRKHLRWLRRFILPRKGDVNDDVAKLRGLGGLSVQRLQTIRDLYQVLKAFRMRPEPDDLNKNVPQPGDESLARFGRRILDQLERMREQRIKQLASRVVEAALGAGRMQQSLGRDRKRPQERTDRPCHAVVVENLEHYKPEDSRLRRENRQLMNWAARNVRKYIMEGCQLHGLHFAEVSPTYTSRQDSRTGAPGIRCEDVSRKVLEEAARREIAGSPADSAPATRFEREVRRWTHEIARVLAVADTAELKPRERVLRAVVQSLSSLPTNRSVVRLPRRGGEIFVSADANSPLAGGTQADLNAAANIGLKALTDPDWEGAWWFVLVNPANGEVIREKVQGSAVWDGDRHSAVIAPETNGSPESSKGRRARRQKAAVYAFSPLFGPSSSTSEWMQTRPYWEAVEHHVANRLEFDQSQPDSPF